MRAVYVSLKRSVDAALYEQVVDGHAERRRVEATLDALDVFAILNRRHDGRVSRGAADALLFERLDERRLCVARRRFREVLFGRDRVELQVLALRDQRQLARSLRILVLRLLVAPF